MLQGFLWDPCGILAGSLWDPCGILAGSLRAKHFPQGKFWERPNSIFHNKTTISHVFVKFPELYLGKVLSTRNPQGSHTGPTRIPQESLLQFSCFRKFLLKFHVFLRRSLRKYSFLIHAFGAVKFSRALPDPTFVKAFSK